MIRFTLNGRPVEADEPSNTTVLNWLRAERLTGTKEGCAEGDCGACTVVLRDGDRFRAVNSCLLLLPMLHGREVWTVEGIGTPANPHPVQQAMVDTNGSQCGYCTPGFVMSLFEACYRDDLDEGWKVDDQLCGNLCRCTGYRPIRDAATATAGTCPSDRFASMLEQPTPAPEPLDHGDAERFVAPTEIGPAVEFLAAHPDARIVCGATDLGLDVTKKGQRFPLLLSTEHIAEAQGIVVTDDGWSVGAATWLTDLEDWSAEELPVLHRMLRYFGARQIKHRASIGGNLCNASPIGDIAPVLLMLDARMLLAGSRGNRTVTAEQFFVDYRQTALQPGELLLRVQIPRPPAHAYLGAYKVSRRRELDISAVSAAMRVEMSKDGTVGLARLAYGGMAATPKRARQTEASLVGGPWTEAAAARAAQHLAEDFTPMDDHRGTAWFRRTLAKNLLVGFAHETADGPEFTALPDGHSGTVVAR
jgi:xanthine dehydrogenase small subunit